jgi:hypothetical protein
MAESACPDTTVTDDLCRSVDRMEVIDKIMVMKKTK